ncbi:hypothetical protein HY484_01835 [Candidatus Woesearchaeota archaeon]|nr:hypothetical protein [Candidatus Woesearchaeota archaeon]
MEQYFLRQKLDFKNLRLCLNNYEAEQLFIRLVGSSGGTVKVNEKLAGKKLDFKKNKSGLHFLIDSKEVFNFPLKDYGEDDIRGAFSLAYERVEQINGIDRLVMLSTGEDPYDPKLPEPRRSFLRHVLDNHLLEIYFKGRIHLKFHSWYDKECRWKYWAVRE